MKNWKVTIVIEGLGGIKRTQKVIPAKTEVAALREAYKIIGNQSGYVEKISA